MTRSEVVSNSEGEQEQQRRTHGQANQGKIHDAVQFAPALAVAAVRKVALVVAAHFRRNAGNVIAPTGEDTAHKFVGALRSHVFFLRRHYGALKAGSGRAAPAALPA